MDTPVSSASDSPSPPSLFLTGEQLQSFNFGDVAVGDTVTAQVTFRVSGANEPSGGGELGGASKTLEVVSIDDVSPSVGGDLEGEEDSNDMIDDSPNTVPTPEDLPQDVVPPDQSGLEDSPAGEEADTTEKMLGYKRPKRKEGLPIKLATMRSQFR